MTELKIEHKDIPHEGNIKPDEFDLESMKHL